jgi:hypothetical protein
MRKTLSQTERYLVRKHRHKIWRHIVGVLACLVVFCTTYALILPAITMEKKAYCGMEEHQHEDSCYVQQLVCELPESTAEQHIHTESCYETRQDLICPLEETEGHTHTEECMQRDVSLVCPLEEDEEHTHDESCYMETITYVCGQEESTGHTHTAECYETVMELVCQLKENLTEPHTHSDACYETVLQCTKTEHTHTLACYSDETADVETASEWEATLPALCGDRQADVLAVAKSQLGYTESTRNYIVTEDGSQKGYTRYGAWYEKPYEDWGAMFVAFCLSHAKVDDLPLTTSVDRWIELLSGDARGLYHDAATYTPLPGDLIFFKDAADHVGLVAEVDLDKASCKIIEGNQNGCVQYGTYQMSDSRIIGYGELPGRSAGEEEPTADETVSEDMESVIIEEPTESEESSEEENKAAVEESTVVDEPAEEELTDALDQAAEEASVTIEELTENTESPEVEESTEEPNLQIYKYEDESVSAEVVLPEDTTVPENAVLTVWPITSEDSRYEELARQAEEALSGQQVEPLFYDISFYTEEEVYLPVADTATVSLCFKESVLSDTDGDVAILHYEADAAAPVTLNEVEISQDENDGLSEITFQTEGFSVFAVVKVVGTSYTYLTSVDTTQLDGKSYYIVNNNKNRSMSTDARSESALPKGLLMTETFRTLWTFTHVDGQEANVYYIHSGDNYLKMEQSGDNGNLTMTVAAEASPFTVMTVQDESGNEWLGIKAEERYLNNFTGSNTYFAGWKDLDGGSRLYLTEPDLPDDTDDLLETQLGGKTFAIVNFTTQKAMLAKERDGENGTTALTPQSFTTFSDNGITYVSGDSITQWYFAGTEEEGWYYISPSDNLTQYLHLERISSNYNYGSLTLSETPQKIRVTSAGNGTVLLYTADNGGCYINSSGSADDKRFWGYNGTDSNSQQTLCVVADGLISYDLNLTTPGAGWQDGTPAIEQNYVTITNDETITLPVPSYAHEEAGVSGIAGLYRFKNNAPSNVEGFYNLPEYTQGNWYGEMRFDGWEYTVDGTTYLLDAGAAVTRDEDGNMIVEVSRIIEAGSIITVEPQTITLSGGASLQGKWTEVSRPITFYVNYTGTILDTEDNVSGRRTNDFTKAVAVGRIYYAKAAVGTDEFFASGINDQLQNAFVSQFDADNPDMQIVISRLLECTSVTQDENGIVTSYQVAMSKEASGANAKMIGTATMEVIKESQREVKLSSAQVDENGQLLRATVDSTLCDGEHYEIRWYVLKSESDSWHVDGVLVAISKQLPVNKVFNGLSDEQVEAILKNYKISVYLGRTDTTNQYVDLVTNPASGTAGQFTYNGNTSDSQRYQWSLNVITGQDYTLKEDSYSLEGYDCSTVISIRDADGTYYYAVGDSTTALKDYSLIGGTAASVTINNFYTPNNTGALAILKTETYDSNTRLQGAEFTLTKTDSGENAIVVTATSNSSGVAFFENLENGTYTLQETTAPTGYVANTTTWTVTVENGTVKVYTGEATEQAETYYQDHAITQYLQVENTKNEDTVVIKKTFHGISDAELAVIRANSYAGGTNPYSITLKDENENAVLSRTTSEPIVLYLNNADAVSPDGRTFTWYLAKSSETCTITEENLSQNNYKDVAVSVKAYGVDSNGTAQTETTPTITRIREEASSALTAAEFTVELQADYANEIEITNDYINTWQLQVKKIEDTNAQKVLSGAGFKIYGPYTQSTKTSDSISYVVDNQSKKAYYIDTITSDEKGIAAISGLYFSTDYVVVEVAAPEGYALDDTPQIVNVTTGTDGYEAGIASLNFANTKKENAKTNLTVTKQWSDGSHAGDSITVNLYRKTEGSNKAELVAGAEITNPVTLNSSSNWTYTWENLPQYDADAKEYTYYICEQSVPGYSTSYSTDAEKLTVVSGNKMETVMAAPVTEGYKNQRSITITNTPGFELPGTGGRGGIGCYLLGGIFVLGVCLFSIHLEAQRKLLRKHL